MSAIDSTVLQRTRVFEQFSALDRPDASGSVGNSTVPILTHEERVGTLLADKYRLESILGRGGMGAVFRGRHEWTGRRVAVKLLNHEIASEPEMAERFLREARTSAELKHANVVDVLDMGRDADGSVYLVLELLEGSALADLIAPGPLSTELAFTLLLPVMRALALAHRKGVIHRDLKPDNIFASEDAEGRIVPKLLDFGIAKVVEQSRTSVTRTGAVLGTPEYMSPEQARGMADIGPPSDVWSMGVVWFETLTGRVPFEGAGPSALIIAIATTAAPGIATYAPSMHPALVAAIDRALIADRSQRWPDMGAFMAALLDAASQMGLQFGADASPIFRSALPGVSSSPLTDEDRRTSLLSTSSTSLAHAPDALPLVTRGSATSEVRSDTRMTWTKPESNRPRSSLRVALLAVGGLAAVAAITVAALSLAHRSETRSAAATPAHTDVANTTPPSIPTEQPAPATPGVIEPTPTAVQPPTLAVAAPTHAAPAIARSAHNAPPPPPPNGGLVLVAPPALPPPPPVAATSNAVVPPVPPPAPVAPPPAAPDPESHPHHVTHDPAAPSHGPNVPLTEYE